MKRMAGSMSRASSSPSTTSCSAARIDGEDPRLIRNSRRIRVNVAWMEHEWV
jgi:hypothetical protein